MSDSRALIVFSNHPLALYVTPLANIAFHGFQRDMKLVDLDKLACLDFCDALQIMKITVRE